MIQKLYSYSDQGLVAATIVYQSCTSNTLYLWYTFDTITDKEILNIHKQADQYIEWSNRAFSYRGAKFLKSLGYKSIRLGAYRGTEYLHANEEGLYATETEARNAFIAFIQTNLENSKNKVKKYTEILAQMNCQI